LLRGGFTRCNDPRSSNQRYRWVTSLIALLLYVNNNSPTTETYPSSKRRYEVLASHTYAERGHVTLIVLAQPFQHVHPATQLWEDPLGCPPPSLVSCRFLPQIYYCMLSKGILYLISRAGGGRTVSSTCADDGITHQRSYPCGRWIVGGWEIRTSALNIDACVPASRNGSDITAQEQKHQGNDVM
jgi:hypothetical protein